MILARTKLDLALMFHQGREDTWIKCWPRGTCNAWHLCPTCIPAMYRRAMDVFQDPGIPFNNDQDTRVTNGMRCQRFEPYHAPLHRCDGCQRGEGGGPVSHALLIKYA